MFSHQYIRSYKKEQNTQFDTVLVFLDLQRKLGQATLTEAAKLSLSDQRIIYQAFFSLTVPHLYISKQQFNKFMASTLGWPPEVLDNLFRSFNIRPKKSNEIKVTFQIDFHPILENWNFCNIPSFYFGHYFFTHFQFNSKNHSELPIVAKVFPVYKTTFYPFLNSSVDQQLVNHKRHMAMLRERQDVDTYFDIMTR